MSQRSFRKKYAHDNSLRPRIIAIQRSSLSSRKSARSARERAAIFERHGEGKTIWKRQLHTSARLEPTNYVTRWFRNEPPAACRPVLKTIPLRERRKNLITINRPREWKKKGENQHGVIVRLDAREKYPSNFVVRTSAPLFCLFFFSASHDSCRSMR